MSVGADELAQAVRLAGAVTVGLAACRAAQGDRTARPLRTALAGTAALLAGGLGLLAATLAPIAVQLEESLVGIGMDYLQQTIHGRLLFAPVLPAIYVLVLLDMLRNANTPAPARALRWMLGAAGFAMAWILAIGGHTAMPQATSIETIASVLHVVSALAWLALVVCLLFPFPAQGSTAQLLRRFGNHALLLVALLVVCGLVTASARGVRVESIGEGRYGLLLAAKSTLLLVALVAAACNRYVVLPRRDRDASFARALLTLEAAALCAIVVLAAALSRTPPPA